uniref:Uncharacterized protein n=1 Tax=Aplanochytrium stocchinoi TaxID=215587 RepID=A0A7S3PGY0_9STRA|mmetsp:Transcript_4977/g.6471  ORF Transcript_4977/g.6471 Transcript_4977/m.6471 type:complete len:283 (+) Transcript_4977:147-995(+)|eukprot:CAMPEP_0204861648 /NCGR_PEP_ID=MMETSP1348-20121228/1785_1 /ASSEMBLY_ACC=CAM_ASM_000700 /TAXON_ID=215587 /ORGANISM="Aplanochytrium stocchinoi, Strain GSBS06" /LENGTH=282 /DNA_ID=CAMNT_0052011165 /DNA_START=79 /DNA_END=927 /DNA_ORIENTATION=+
MGFFRRKKRSSDDDLAIAKTAYDNVPLAKVVDEIDEEYENEKKLREEQHQRWKKDISRILTWGEKQEVMVTIAKHLLDLAQDISRIEATTGRITPDDIKNALLESWKNLPPYTLVLKDPMAIAYAESNLAAEAQTKFENKLQEKIKAYVEKHGDGAIDYKPILMTAIESSTTPRKDSPKMLQIMLSFIGIYHHDEVTYVNSEKLKELVGKVGTLMNLAWTFRLEGPSELGTNWQFLLPGIQSLMSAIDEASMEGGGIEINVDLIFFVLYHFDFKPEEIAGRV